MLQCSVAGVTSEKEMAEIVEKVISNNKETGGKLPCLSVLHYGEEEDKNPSPFIIPARLNSPESNNPSPFIMPARMIGKYTDPVETYYDERRK